MSALHSDIQLERALGDTLDGLFAGTIAEPAADTTTMVQVLLDAFDPALRFGPCAWPSRVVTVTVNVADSPESAHNVDIAQAVLPARGDRCWVAFDDSETPVIVMWWPA